MLQRQLWRDGILVIVRLCCENCYEKFPAAVKPWLGFKKLWGICKYCHRHEWCALMDVGYDWMTGTYSMTEQTFNADYYTDLASSQLSQYPLLCAVMGPNSRKRFAGSVARAVKKSIDLNPHVKPDYYAIRDAVASDPDLKGFIPAFILMALFSWAIQKLLDFIFDNWTATPNGAAR